MKATKNTEQKKKKINKFWQDNERRFMHSKEKRSKEKKRKEKSKQSNFAKFRNLISPKFHASINESIKITQKSNPLTCAPICGNNVTN